MIIIQNSRKSQNKNKNMFKMAQELILLYYSMHQECFIIIL